MRTWTAATFVVALVLFSGCRRATSDALQGYIEGEYVYVASPLAGRLDSLAVARGQMVEASDLLFELECGAEEANLKQARERLAQGEAQLADAEKGMRPTELDALTAAHEQSLAAYTFAESEFLRNQDLFKRGVVAAQTLDASRAGRDYTKQMVAQAKSKMETAHLGERADQIVAARANVAALKGALAYAEWALAQKRQVAPMAGMVFDTLYTQGEWVAAGRPVVSLLPFENRKVRTFVPEPLLGTLVIGQEVSVRVEGIAELAAGKITFISPQVEFTPPVIYSQDMRSKLSFMIEIRFDPETAKNLHPGQPVEVFLRRLPQP